MKSKYFAFGALLGLLLGFLLVILLPGFFLTEGLAFNRLFNQGAGYPSDFYSLKSGSIYNSLMFFPTLLGLIGGILGLVLFKIKRNL